MLRESVTDKGIFEEDLEEMEFTCRNLEEQKKSRCKGSEVGVCLTCSNNGKEDSITEGESAKGKSSSEIRAVKSDRDIWIT